MIDSIRTTFLSNYLTSLRERSRIEKKGTRVGIDWVIYNLGMAKNWTPLRLPFYRTSEQRTPKTKPEAEFGIDLAFLSKEQELVVFILKDEALTYNNWKKHDFASDFQMATTVDPNYFNLEQVKVVRIILAYNKDENDTGVQIYDRSVNAAVGTRNDGVELKFEKWNLTRMTEEVQDHLLSPDLLPNELTSALHYICMQVQDFDFGSQEWHDRLIPQWQYFLSKLLSDPVDARKIQLVPVTLLIVHQYKKDAPNSCAGWIDLIEWAMLSLFEVYGHIDDKSKGIILNVWTQLYVAELGRYFDDNYEALVTEHGLCTRITGHGLLGAINDAYVAHWHLGRLGILNLAPQEFIEIEEGQNRERILEHVDKNAELLIRFLNANPSAYRPLIDLNHIEIYLVWLILWQAGRQDDIVAWLSKLEDYLATRRANLCGIPFIESWNRLSLVAEFAETSKRPVEFKDKSSYLLLMILELCFSLEKENRDHLLARYFNRIVKGIDLTREDLDEIDLLGWVPPDDWCSRIVKETVTDGISIQTCNFEYHPNDNRTLQEKLISSVEKEQEKFNSNLMLDIPQAVAVLGCIKHKSPLPSEFWRDIIFPTDQNAGDQTETATT